MPTPLTQRVQKRRDAMRASGLRPVQIWLPDTRSPNFIEECRRQSKIVSATDAMDDDTDAFIDAVLTDLENEAGA